MFTRLSAGTYEAGRLSYDELIMKRDMEREQMEVCFFKPKINKPYPTEKDNNPNIERFEKLYQDAYIN